MEDSENINGTSDNAIDVIQFRIQPRKSNVTTDFSSKTSKNEGQETTSATEISIITNITV